MSKLWIPIGLLLFLTNCGTDLTKYDLAYLACGEGLGFDQAGIDNLWYAFRDMRASGVAFEDAVAIGLQACGGVFGGNTDNGASCRACLSLIAEGVYNSDGSGPAASAIPTTLDLKMPLPGGKSWLLTTEAGGGDCASADDDSHTGISYYSLDFDNVSLDENGGGVMYYDADTATEREEMPVIVYAAAGGKVVTASETESPDNGYFVVIDHDYDGNISTGFSTRYLHLKDKPSVRVGQTVSTGSPLGLVGNTGRVWGNPGTHLHFGVRFENKGDTSPEMRQVRIEDRLVTDYKTACRNGVRMAYYYSSNTR